MSSRHLVDPELTMLLDAWPVVHLTHESLPALRDPARLPVIADPATEALVDSRSFVTAGEGGDIALLSYRPKGLTGDLPCIYHIHGGGYVGGSAHPLAPQHRALALELGCVLVSVEYRLAPENPFPASIEDCYSGLAWTFAQGAELGIDVERIGVMGESAGGGLAAALALMARDRGDYQLAFQHLIYPMLDDRTCVTADPHGYAGEFIWTAHNNRFGWSALLGHEPGRDGVSPYAAPARTENLSRLPMTYIAAGGLDLFVDEDIDYAKRLMRAGVPVELHVYPGGFHGFDFDPAADVSLRANRDSKAALRRAMRTTT